MFKVIVADDEPMVRMALANLIDWGQLDCELLHQAVDGNDLIDSMKKFKPDIIVSDIKMPGKDGVEISKYIYENKLNTKVILFTAYADFLYAKSAIKYDVVDYVIKTGSVDAIIKAVEKAKQIIEKENVVDTVNSKENFLKAYIDESLYNEDEISKAIVDLELDIKKYVVLNVVFEINKNNNKRSSKDVNLSLFNFFNMGFSKYKNFIINLSKDSFVIIVYDLYINTYVNTIKRVCNEILDIAKSFMYINLKIGVSRLSNDIKELKKLYKQTNDALSEGFLDNNKLYFYENKIKLADSVLIQENDKLLDTLCHEIQKGNEQKSLDLLDKIFTLQKDNKFSEKQIKSSGLLIENKCNAYLAEHDVRLKDISKQNIEFYSSILKCKFFREYCDLLKNVIVITSHYIDSYKCDTDVLILECKRFIEENFDKDISLNDIAKKLNVSNSYLSRLYKEKTGNTILNVINTMRIEKAKECLVKTDMRIYEVANAIGIDEPAYFSHFFKRYTNYTPKEFKIKYNNYK